MSFLSALSIASTGAGLATRALRSAYNAMQAKRKPTYTPPKRTSSSSSSTYSSTNYTQPLPSTNYMVPDFQTYEPPKPVGEMPLPINFDEYKMQNATLKDLQDKYGFDYSREYANRMAELEAQKKQTGYQNQLENMDSDLKMYSQKLDTDYYQKFLEAMQQQANNGRNAGIQADANLRLNFNKQQQMANFLEKDRVKRSQIENDLAQLPYEEQLRAEQLYQDRLNQGFKNLMQLDQLNGSNLDRLLKIDEFNRQMQLDQYKYLNMSAEQQAAIRLSYERLQEEKKQFATEQQWREYQYTHMSATERAQLEADRQKWGEELAWRRYELEKTQQFQWDSQTRQMLFDNYLNTMKLFGTPNTNLPNF